jgi:hypothetical protein
MSLNQTTGVMESVASSQVGLSYSVRHTHQKNLTLSVIHVDVICGEKYEKVKRKRTKGLRKRENGKYKGKINVK